MDSRMWMVVALFLAASAAGPAANAGHTCAGYSVTTIDSGAGEVLYLASPDDPTGTHWLYVETNGNPGLQRGDSFDPILDDSNAPYNWLDQQDHCWQGYPDQVLAYI